MSRPRAGDAGEDVVEERVVHHRAQLRLVHDDGTPLDMDTFV